MDAPLSSRRYARRRGRARLAALALGAALAAAAAPGLALHPEAPQAQTLAAAPASYRQAAAGDVVQVRLGELRPTQGAIGYDAVYYTLARWQADFDRPTWRDRPAEHLRYLQRTVGKKFTDYCIDTGQGGLADGALASVGQLRAARLDTPASFACRDAPGTHAQALKSAVVGWDGRLYLTDGHHSFSALYEVPDGGPGLPVWVRVEANYSDSATPADFWRRMRDARRAWLRDGRNRPLAPELLSERLGLAGAGRAGGLQDDPYRALVSFTRGIGYDNQALPDFGEFLWADWLRGRLDLSAYQLGRDGAAGETLAASGLSRRALAPTGSRHSYVAAVRDAALLMTAQDEATPIAEGQTAGALGRITLRPGWPPGPADQARKTLRDLPRDDVAADGGPRTGGKLWYAVNYRRCGPPSDRGACWSRAATP